MKTPLPCSKYDLNCIFIFEKPLKAKNKIVKGHQKLSFGLL